MKRRKIVQILGVIIAGLAPVVASRVYSIVLGWERPRRNELRWFFTAEV